MALICCNKCGKKISDTAHSCVHCGAPLEDNITQEETTVSQENAHYLYEIVLPQFGALPEDQQIALENEFLKSDKRARNFYRKTIEYKKFFLIFFIILPVFSVLLKIQEKIVGSFEDSAAYNQTMIDIAETFALLSVFIWVFTAAVEIYYIIVLRNKFKQLAYSKKLQKWLREEKAIIYDPIFDTEKEKNMFEQIDADSAKL